MRCVQVAIVKALCKEEISAINLASINAAGKPQMTNSRDFAVSRALSKPGRFQQQNSMHRIDLCPNQFPSAAHPRSGRSRSVVGCFMDWQLPFPTSRFATCGNRWITGSHFSALRF